ncbi:hypothetical protein ACFOVU_00055 [Nocardiopsis sediminis]|uniref:Integral membrane protein n=1 Tax=Nocardiopsis sediminis TaxID=1778267 RepID=A0ABV8FGS5_9ACTN
MAASTTTRQGLLTFLRVAIILQTLLVFVQAVSAGLVLATPYGEPLHSIGARVVFAAAMLHVVAAVVVWRPGGGSFATVLYAAGFLVLMSAQVVVGIMHVMALHVPLGVVLFAMSVLRLAWIGSGRRPRAAGAA